MYINIHVYIFTYIYIYICIYNYLCASVYVYRYTIHIHTLFVYIYIYVCVYIYIYYTYTWHTHEAHHAPTIYTHIHIHRNVALHTHTQLGAPNLAGVGEAERRRELQDLSAQSLPKPQSGLEITARPRPFWASQTLQAPQPPTPTLQRATLKRFKAPLAQTERRPRQTENLP